MLDATVTNAELTDQLLTVLTEEGLSMCRGSSGSEPHLPACSIPWWQGNVTRVDSEKAIIEVGDFPAYATDTVGHSARFQRISEGTLEITVKGIFFYYGTLPNDDVAKRLANIIDEGLGTAAGIAVDEI